MVVCQVIVGYLDGMYKMMLVWCDQMVLDVVEEYGVVIVNEC